MSISLFEAEVDIPTRDGIMNTFVVHPGDKGPYPIVIFYMDAAGRREELSNMARRIASEGYYTALPNLYYRKTRDFHMRDGDEGLWEMLTLMWTLNNRLVVEDTSALLDFIASDDSAAGSTIGGVGYCMGAPFAIAAAEAFSSKIKCVASIHGSQLVTDRGDSPHRLVETVTAEMYFGCAEFDEWADSETIATLAAALSRGRAPYQIEWYPGAHHGFVFPQRADAYDEKSAERHWDRLMALFARHLR